MPFPLANVNVRLTEYCSLLLFSTVQIKTPPGIQLSYNIRLHQVLNYIANIFTNLNKI